MTHSAGTILSLLSRQPATHSWLAHHADAVAYWRSLNPEPTIEEVLAKTYACEGAPKGEKAAKANPAACLPTRSAFARDVAEMLAGMKSHGHETATWEDGA